MLKLPARQVHLDFHTSEQIADVGRDFEAKEFQAALQLGHVNSITVFAKCHHSWSYYPTAVGRPHPTLHGDLLGAQIAACHEIGVRAPIYYTVGWSANDAKDHPEWTVRNQDGSIAGTSFDPKAGPEDPIPTFCWQFLCPSGEYRQLILAQTREICERYPVDGFFYDICFHGNCYCANCLAAMKAAGLDPAKKEDVRRYQITKWQSLQDECNALIHSLHPEATIFYNGGAGQYDPQWHGRQTHFELEDLPTTWGGYDKFPVRARYFANKGKQYLAMSGKFHTAWGEFGGFKDPEAIRFEAACMVAYGARCSFGDQLHPLGHVDRATYENIGKAYAYVEQIEEYSLDGVPASNLGLWLCGSTPDDQGVVNMLLETQTDFEVVDPSRPLKRYETLILPGAPCLDETSAAALSAYVAEGGSLLVLGTGALDREKSRFLLDTGADYQGPARFVEDYLLAGEALSQGMIAAPFRSYTAGIRVRAQEGTTVLAAIQEPYFDRTYGHYCSHQNTPYRTEEAGHPGAWRKGNVVSLAHPLGAIYYRNGARLHRQLFLNALSLIYRHPVVTTSLPSAGRISLVHQPARRRYVAHLMYGPPLQRGNCSVIEDLVPLRDVPVTLAVPQAVTRAFLAPSGQALPLQTTGGKLSITVPEFTGHQAVVFEY